MLANDRFALIGIMESIAQIETYLDGNHTLESFKSDPRTVDACLMHLVQIGEMVSRLSEEFIEAHHGMEWFKIKGLRNIIAHDYFGIDLQEIHSVIEIHLPKLKDYIAPIIKA